MSSLWKDLLFLHGHMTQASLIWSDIDTADRDAATRKKPTPRAQTCAAACCAVAGLPRIAAPR